jgi:hypothetical protein
MFYINEVNIRLEEYEEATKGFRMLIKDILNKNNLLLVKIFSCLSIAD